MERSGLWTPDPTDHTSSITLSSTHISQAKQGSKDGCITLNFASLNLTDISAAAVEELLLVGKASGGDAPQRITLGRNRLARLPPEFVLLSHLRYLNLERNNLTVFPDVLVSMPALDILDISYNKIRKLPSEAGRLVNLRVLCVKRNKLTRLPDYLCDFHNLEILQLEKNPLEWPPPRVIETISKSQPQESRSVDVQALKRWLETNQRETAAPDLSGYSDPSSNDLSDRDWHSQLSASTDQSFDRWPHSRSFSVESSLSMSSIAERLEDDENVDSDNDRSQGRLPKFFPGPPTDNLRQIRREPSSKQLTPTEGGVSKGFENLRIDTQTTNGKLSLDTPLAAKKSMPDLRTARMNFTKKSGVLPDSQPFSANDGTDSPNEFSRSPVSTTRSRLDSDAETTKGILKVREAGPASASVDRGLTLDTSAGSRKSVHPLSYLADTARSLVFTITKVHATLQQHLTPDEGINSMTRKILEPLGHDLSQLSHALDAFESIRQKTLPPPAVCRTLVECCKDAVAGFRHTLELLNPLLQVPSTGIEMRLARWLLVEVWAATAEIAIAWQTFLPMLHSITPWLPARPTLHAFPSRSLSSALPPIVHPPALMPSGARMTHLALGPPTTPESGGGRSRRHAGSFSYKDVELGKLLPANEEFPQALRGIAQAQGATNEPPTLRAPKRHMTIPLTTIQSPSPTAPDQAASSTTYQPWIAESDRHSRQVSQTSVYSNPQSPLVPSKSFLELASHESDPTQEAIRAVLVAVDIAPSVWNLLDSMAQEGTIIDYSIQGLIQTSRDATIELGNVVNDSVLDIQMLQRVARFFLKTVVQVSNMVKSFGRPQDFPPILRSKMLELTNATEHFAMLLHLMTDAPNGTQSRSISPIGSFAPIDSVKTSHFDDPSLSSSVPRGRTISAANGHYLSPTPAGAFLKPALSRSVPAFDRSGDRRHGDPG